MERRSISTIHVRWQTGEWFIETRNAAGETLNDSRQGGWDGPRPQRYQAHEAERLRLDLQNWEPEAPVFMHTDA